MHTTQLFDYHSHSNFSTDGSYTMEQMANAAVCIGISQLAITDHYDPDYPLSGWSEGFSPADNYSALEKTKVQFKDKLILVKGLEVGIQHGPTLDKCTKTVNSFDYDFIIGSFHCAEGFELSCGGFFENRSVENATESFYKYNYDCLSLYKNYDVLGHFNVIDRYGEYIPPYAQLWDIITEILKMIIYDGKGIEINTSSFRYGMGDYTTPSEDILRLYHSLGGEIITVGSDAHVTRDIGYGLEWAYEKMKSVGFRYVTTYSQRKPSFVKLK